MARRPRRTNTASTLYYVILPKAVNFPLNFLFWSFFRSAFPKIHREKKIFRGGNPWTGTMFAINSSKDPNISPVTCWELLTSSWGNSVLQWSTHIHTVAAAEYKSITPSHKGKQRMKHGPCATAVQRPVMHHCFLFVLWLCGSTCGHRVWHTGLTVCWAQQWWGRSNDPGNEAACGHTVQVWEQHKLWVTSNYLPTWINAGLRVWVIVLTCTSTRLCACAFQFWGATFLCPVKSLLCVPA